jgi:hypothetical protein
MEEERRQHPRTESEWLARIQKEELFFDGIVRNVSHSGAYICCDRKLLPTEKVRMAMEHSDRRPLVIDAEVIWSRILSQDETCGAYGVGLRFAEVYDKGQRLTEPAKLTSGKACPECKSMAGYRIRRRFWMRLILRSRFYHCEDCGCNYVTVFELFSFRWGSGIRY